MREKGERTSQCWRILHAAYTLLSLQDSLCITHSSKSWPIEADHNQMDPSTIRQINEIIILHLAHQGWCVHCAHHMAAYISRICSSIWSDISPLTSSHVNASIKKQSPPHQRKQVLQQSIHEWDYLTKPTWKQAWRVYLCSSKAKGEWGEWKSHMFYRVEMEANLLTHEAMPCSSTLEPSYHNTLSSLTNPAMINAFLFKFEQGERRESQSLATLKLKLDPQLYMQIHRTRIFI